MCFVLRASVSFALYAAVLAAGDHPAHDGRLSELDADGGIIHEGHRQPAVQLGRDPQAVLAAEDRTQHDLQSAVIDAAGEMILVREHQPAVQTAPHAEPAVQTASAAQLAAALIRQPLVPTHTGEIGADGKTVYERRNGKAAVLIDAFGVIAEVRRDGEGGKDLGNDNMEMESQDKGHTPMPSLLHTDACASCTVPQTCTEDCNPPINYTGQVCVSNEDGLCVTPDSTYYCFDGPVEDDKRKVEECSAPPSPSPTPTPEPNPSDEPTPSPSPTPTPEPTPSDESQAEVVQAGAEVAHPLSVLMAVVGALQVAAWRGA